MPRFRLRRQRACRCRQVEALEEPAVLAELRELYARWNLAPTSGEDPAVIQLLQEAERREEEDRRAKFDVRVRDVRAGWTALEKSGALFSFAKMRDKFIAHSELWHNGTKYLPLDVATLGLKLGDVRTVMEELQATVDLLTLIYRNSSFAFDDLDQQASSTRDMFWAAHSGGATNNSDGDAPVARASLPTG